MCGGRICCAGVSGRTGAGRALRDRSKEACSCAARRSCARGGERREVRSFTRWICLKLGIALTRRTVRQSGYTVVSPWFDTFSLHSYCNHSPHTPHASLHHPSRDYTVQRPPVRSWTLVITRGCTVPFRDVVAAIRCSCVQARTIMPHPLGSLGHRSSKRNHDVS